MSENKTSGTSLPPTDSTDTERPSGMPSTSSPSSKEEASVDSTTSSPSASPATKLGRPHLQLGGPKLAAPLSMLAMDQVIQFAKPYGDPAFFHKVKTEGCPIGDPTLRKMMEESGANYPMKSLMGLDVMFSANALERRQIRFPRSKKKRIRAKWAKREENVEYVPTTFMMGRKLVTHPSLRPVFEAVTEAIPKVNPMLGALMGMMGSMMPPADELAEVSVDEFQQRLESDTLRRMFGPF